MNKKVIAVIGTGIMGSGIAKNFLENGYKVIVWNRTKEKLKEFKKSGAIIANSPREATRQADIVFEVTANDKSSKSVWLGKNGIISSSNKNKALIVCGTLSLIWVKQLASICSKNKFTFFDMPMTGSRAGAENGKLTLLVGGNKAKLKSLENTLNAISEKIFYFGIAGNGTKFKLILNMLQAIHLVGLGEALNLAKKLDLNINDVGNTLIEKPGGAPTNSGWKGYQKEPAPINSSIEWITKDLKYAKEIAKSIKTPLLDEVFKKYNKAVKANRGQKDWTSINRY